MKLFFSQFFTFSRRLPHAAICCAHEWHPPFAYLPDGIPLILISGETLLPLWYLPSYFSGVLCGMFLFLQWDTSIHLLPMFVVARSVGGELLPASTAHPHCGIILQCYVCYQRWCKQKLKYNLGFLTLLYLFGFICSIIHLSFGTVAFSLFMQSWENSKGAKGSYISL